MHKRIDPIIKKCIGYLSFYLIMCQRYMYPHISKNKSRLNLVHCMFWINASIIHITIIYFNLNAISPSQKHYTCRRISQNKYCFLFLHISTYFIINWLSMICFSFTYQNESLKDTINTKTNRSSLILPS